MFRPIAVSALLAFMSTAALAADYQLTVKNKYTDAMSGISVTGGKIHDFKRVPANGKRVFTVTLPDGQCEANIVVTFANGAADDGGAFDFCQFDVLEYNFRP